MEYTARHGTPQFPPPKESPVLAPTARGGSAVIDERTRQMRTASAKLMTFRAPPDA
jgi:hypothetical protein